MLTGPLSDQDPRRVPVTVERRAARIAGFVLLISAVIFAALVSRTPRQHGDWGTQDFIEYWAANQVVAAHGNPYDAVQMLAVEQASGRTDSIPFMMWNPPWLLVLMQRVLRLPFPSAAAAWIGVNIIMNTVACVLIVSGYRRSRLSAPDIVPAVLASLLSVPMVMTIQLGQVSLLLLLAVALLYWAMRARRDLIAGLALAMLSVKPHLFLLVVVLVAIEVVRARRWRLVVGAVAGISALLIAVLLRASSLMSNWTHGLSEPPAGAPAASTWRTPNLPNVIRELLAQWTGHGPSWPLTVIPLVAAVLCAIWLWRRPHAHALDELLPSVLCLSVIAAPFGWTFDHVVLAVPQIIILVRAFAEVNSVARRWMLIGAVTTCHLGLVVQSQTTGTDYFGFWWFPPAVLGIWVFSSRFISLAARVDFPSR
ncbi:MAG: DUF2029 domain-containing protein [Gemmatimonadaceae bacterium]|nr:DUF2029 domain-containing protein [Gemmatimonadaceae bacterium]